MRDCGKHSNRKNQGDPQRDKHDEEREIALALLPLQSNMQYLFASTIHPENHMDAGGFRKQSFMQSTFSQENRCPAVGGAVNNLDYLEVVHVFIRRKNSGCKAVYQNGKTL
ncbi:hypothetical protein HC248_01929 [Polaromonas vacuolata]|uniref:Uncharacterized protein n=1 Tax=Polaromonas vacuolata TaxID=37448 RepID=A0A6H2H9R7_9BURK|nr:hypothetical protein HC248_01929 [Polaromonas vacuolata]